MPITLRPILPRTKSLEQSNVTSAPTALRNPPNSGSNQHTVVPRASSEHTHHNATDSLINYARYLETAHTTSRDDDGDSKERQQLHSVPSATPTDDNQYLAKLQLMVEDSNRRVDTNSLVHKHQSFKMNLNFMCDSEKSSRESIDFMSVRSLKGEDGLAFSFDKAGGDEAWKTFRAEMDIYTSKLLNGNVRRSKGSGS